MADKRSALKQGQIDILEVLYKYRFGSRQLIADSLDIKAGSSLYEKLNVLIKHGLVAMRQEKQLKLLGVPAAYFLTSKGLKTLQSLDGHDYITEATIKAGYRDKILKQATVSHNLDVYRYTNVLGHQHPGLKVYLRRDMSRFSYFPDSPPDAFLSLKLDDIPKRFFLDFIPDNMLRSVLYRCIASYAEFFEEGGWDVTNSELPKLLFVAEKDATANRVRRTARAALSRVDSDLEVYVTTIKELLDMDSTGKIWTDISEPDELLSLADI
ncbi:MAG TPA: hypothetical protein VJ841_01225 [Candidatus Saccharimonadales bacterium]|nr:hypothetical protein [Candidatus Saccharimonadales bacterium]